MSVEKVNIENTHAEVHHGPHIPEIQWKKMDIWIPGVSTITITTMLFALLVFLFVMKARSLLKTDKKSRLKAGIISFVKFFDKYLIDSFENKKTARKKYSLIVWVFSIVLFGNLFWLIIDWVWSIFPILFEYLRPINSDLNTTLSLWLWTIVFSLFLAVKYHWIVKVLKWFFFNFSWKTIMDKIINVFVGWLHLIWQLAAVTSLSLRLFGNIFAWMILISVIWYLWVLMSENLFEVGRFLTIPFWFFEIFVAFVQAVVFAWLMIAYFKQSIEWDH